MHKDFISSIFILALAVFSLGCDKLCKKTVQDFATIQNATGRQLVLGVCKGRAYGEVQMNVAPSTSSQEVDLGSRQDGEVRGGPTASCSGVSDSRQDMGISLAQSSFGQVKLCYNDSEKLNVIVENYQSCPSGYLEQTSTGPCVY
jgi:hypothetical protein